MSCDGYRPGKAFPEYGSWHAMRTRCTNPRQKSYREYGGRGIRVCDRWKSFRNFFADLGPKPSPEHQLDRIDTNGNYEPSNCRWADVTTQQNNRRDNVVIVIDGRRMTVSEASVIYEIPHSRLLGRLRMGWPPEHAVSRGKSPRGRKPKLAV